MLLVAVIAPLIVVASCNVKRYYEANVRVRPVIAAIEEYKKDFGEYPLQKKMLIPKYIDKLAMNRIYYRLDHSGDTVTYPYLVKTGEIDEGDVRYRLTVWIGGNVHCRYINGDFKECEWGGF
jgi:hypothetical protein